MRTGKITKASLVPFALLAVTMVVVVAISHQGSGKQELLEDPEDLLRHATRDYSDFTSDVKYAAQMRNKLDQAKLPGLEEAVLKARHDRRELQLKAPAKAQQLAPQVVLRKQLRVHHIREDDDEVAIENDDSQYSGDKRPVHDMAEANKEALAALYAEKHPDIATLEKKAAAERAAKKKAAETKKAAEAEKHSAVVTAAKKKAASEISVTDDDVADKIRAASIIRAAQIEAKADIEAARIKAQAIITAAKSKLRRAVMTMKRSSSSSKQQSLADQPPPPPSTDAPTPPPSTDAPTPPPPTAAPSPPPTAAPIVKSKASARISSKRNLSVNENGDVVSLIKEPKPSKSKLAVNENGDVVSVHQPVKASKRKLAVNSNGDIVSIIHPERAMQQQRKLDFARSSASLAAPQEVFLAKKPQQQQQRQQLPQQQQQQQQQQQAVVAPVSKIVVHDDGRSTLGDRFVPLSAVPEDVFE